MTVYVLENKQAPLWFLHIVFAIFIFLDFLKNTQKT